MNIVTEKKCTRCGVLKSIDEFYADRRRPGGKMSACKSCHCIFSKMYHESHEDKSKLYKSNYYIKNSEIVIERDKKWRKDNRERYNRRQLSWSYNNLEKRREISRKGTKK